jgi:hypothetical protein
MKISSVFYPVEGNTFGRTLQLIRLTALYSIYDQNQLNFDLDAQRREL